MRVLESGMMVNKIRTYDSPDISVSYDVKRCIHAEECIHRLGVVFNPKQRPWIAPQNASADEVANTILNCPTGALHFERKDGGAPEPIPAENTINLDPNGPLYARGDIVIVTENEQEVVLKDTRVALCRCGASKIKPFCDNTHKEINFTATNTINLAEGQSAEGDNTGTFKLIVSENGPYLVRGNVKIHGSQVVFSDKAALCRCGSSQNKPYCDGTHEKIGFQG